MAVLPPTRLTDRLARALAFAIHAHAGQVRKATTVPYVSHLLGVASLALEAGGDEDVAIAALLHDTVEDTEVTVADVDAAFGPRVAGIVAACSDTEVSPKPPWEERKRAYLEHLASPSTSRDVLVVSLADKLHNARAILRDYHALGPAVWDRFTRGADDQVWYYRRLADIFRSRLPGPMTVEFVQVVEELGRVAAAG